jgi:hypothetical protein
MKARERAVPVKLRRQQAGIARRHIDPLDVIAASLPLVEAHFA